MLVHRGTIIGRKIIMPVWVSPPGWWEGIKHKAKPVRTEAVIDTGATISCITNQLADKLELVAEEAQEIITAGGTFEQNLYNIDIRIEFPLPNSERGLTGNPHKEFSNIEVVANEANYMLIGMDIIMRGSLEVHGDKFSFSL